MIQCRKLQQASDTSPLQQGAGFTVQPWTTGVLLHVYCVCDRSQYVWEWTHETLHIIISFQHALEPLVDRVCAVQQDKEFLYKRDSQGKLVTRHRRLADPSHGTAIKSFRKTEQLKSKLPQAFWAKSCILFVVWKLFALCSTVASFLIYISKMCNKRNKHTFKEWQILFRKRIWT